MIPLWKFGSIRPSKAQKTINKKIDKDRNQWMISKEKYLKWLTLNKEVRKKRQKIIRICNKKSRN